MGAALSGNNKGMAVSSMSSSTKQHSNNAYQGNNGLQGTPGMKGSGAFLSSQQKEDSPSSIDANSSSQQTKTKAMLKGWEHLGGSATQNANQSGTTTFQQGIQANQSGSNRLSMGKNTSDTFKAFQKAAQEKEQRERTLKEQNDLARQKKEQAERERKRMEHERRKEREE